MSRMRIANVRWTAAIAAIASVTLLACGGGGNTNGSVTPNATNGSVTPRATNGSATPSVTNGSVTPNATNGGATPNANDQAALEQLVKDLGTAMQNHDANGIAALFSAKCIDIQSAVGLGLAQLLGHVVQVNVSGVGLQGMDADSGEVLAKGTINIDGDTQLLEDSGYISVVKENGQWKFSDCSFVGAE
jgi:hypothetical protein